MSQNKEGCYHNPQTLAVFVLLVWRDIPANCECLHTLYQNVLFALLAQYDVLFENILRQYTVFVIHVYNFSCKNMIRGYNDCCILVSHQDVFQLELARLLKLLFYFGIVLSFLSEQTTPGAISINPNKNKLFIVWTVGKYVKIEMDKKILSKPVFALILGCK